MQHSWVESQKPGDTLRVGPPLSGGSEAAEAGQRGCRSSKEHLSRPEHDEQSPRSERQEDDFQTGQSGNWSAGAQSICSARQTSH